MLSSFLNLIFSCSENKNTPPAAAETIQKSESATIGGEEGIKIGSTFQDLLKVVVHGSEIEGRTFANADNASYRLDVANFNYEIDRAKVPATVKFLEIRINRGK